MAAESGGPKKPPKSPKATPKKPAKRATASSAKSAKSSSAPAAKPARSASRAKAAKDAAAAKTTRGASAAKGTSARKSASAQRSTKGAPPARSASKPARPAAERPRRSTPSAKPAAAAQPAVAEVKETVASGPSAKRSLVEGTARSYFDALGARDVRTAAALWHEDAVNDVIPFGILRGQAAIKGFLEEVFAGMPDARFTVDRIIADESGAAVRWRVVGTFSGAPFQGLEPTGSRIDLRGVDNLEIEDGRIVQNTSVFDGAAFVRQIGLLPPEESGADRALRAGFNTVTKLRRTVAKRASR